MHTMSIAVLLRYVCHCVVTIGTIRTLVEHTVYRGKINSVTLWLSL